MMWNYGFQMGWVWVVFGLLVVAGVVAIVIALTRGRAGGPARPLDGETSSVTARRILDERFARGEIDSGEYQERRRTLDPGA